MTHASEHSENLSHSLFGIETRVWFWIRGTDFNLVFTSYKSSQGRGFSVWINQVCSQVASVSGPSSLGCRLFWCSSLWGLGITTLLRPPQLGHQNSLHPRLSAKQQAVLSSENLIRLKTDLIYQDWKSPHPQPPAASCPHLTHSFFFH